MKNRYYKKAVLRKVLRITNKNRYRSLFEKNKEKKILVFLHLFYPESWKEIREYLLNFEGYQWDLCITYPDFIEEKLDFNDIKKLNERTRFICLENRGYDIGPFLFALRQVDFLSYDVIFKLQSKGTHRPWIYIYKQLFIGRDWFRNLFEGIVGANTIHTTIDSIANDASVGLCAASNLIVHDPPHKQNMVVRKLEEYGIHAKKGYFFVAGTCFAIKPQCLKRIADFPAGLTDFVTVPPSRGLSLAHILERYLSIAVSEQGFRLKGNRVMNFERALKKPLEYDFEALSSEKLYDLPYVYDDEFFFWALDHFMVKYRTRKIRLGNLRYRMGKDGKIIPLKECIPYKYLQGDQNAYLEYCRIHQESGRPLMSIERYDALIHSMEEQDFDPAHIIMIDENNILKDGQHRACWMAYQHGLEYETDVLEVKVLAGIDLALEMMKVPFRHLRERHDKFTRSVKD